MIEIDQMAHGALRIWIHNFWGQIDLIKTSCMTFMVDAQIFAQHGVWLSVTAIFYEVNGESLEGVEF